MLKRVYVLGSLLSSSVGLWMLAGPVSWYHYFPGVTDSGPLNVHLVRDLGSVYVMIGTVFVWCAGHVAQARRAHVLVTMYFGVHALIHLTDLVGGRLPAIHWWVDAPTVFLPALALGGLALSPVWRSVADPSSP